MGYHEGSYSKGLVRTPGPDFFKGITNANLGKPSYERMISQHREYIDILESLGIELIVLDPLDNFPDAYFVEDAAFLLPELLIMTRSGATSRQGEGDQIQEILGDGRQVYQIGHPGTLEGGDVLHVGTHFFIGLSSRTNITGANQFGEMVQRYGYSWSTVPVIRGLHLKSELTYIGNGTLLMTEIYQSTPEFSHFKRIVVPKEESRAANALTVNQHLIFAKGNPKTKKQIESAFPGRIIELDNSESQKMDGGLTCMSILW